MANREKQLEDALERTQARRQADLKEFARYRNANANANQVLAEVEAALTRPEPELPPVEEPEEPGPVDPPDEEPGPPDDDTDPEPVPPDEPVEPPPGRPPLYSLQGPLSGLIVPVGISFNNEGATASYNRAIGLKDDVASCWCKPGDGTESHDPRVLNGELFFKANWWRSSPPRTGRVLMYRMVPGDSKKQKDIFKRGAEGAFDGIWRDFAGRAQENARNAGCPWVEVRLLWEHQGDWYGHTVLPEQVADARKAMVRCAHVMRKVAPALRFSVGYASPGRQPYKNTDTVPRAFEDIPNWDGKGTVKLPRLIETISLSWYNKGGVGGNHQSSSTAAGSDAASWEKKITETRNGAPAQLGSWAQWCIKNNMNIGVAEAGNWHDDLPYFADGLIGWIKKYEHIINYVCLLGSGPHSMFGGGAECPKTGQRWLSEVPKRLKVGA